MIQKLKKVSIKDLVGFLKFLIVLVPALIYKLYIKLTGKKILLVCERKNMARDNGYAFYKYLKNEKPEIQSFYAIDYKCSDYIKVKQLGNIIKWSSIKHYFYYIVSTFNISSHKEGNPNHTLFTILHLYLNLFNNRVFLQHGVLYQDTEMFHYSNTKFKIFISGAMKEFEFLSKNYGYENNKLKCTGLARFDNLYDAKVDNQTIAFIPTWRRWINSKKEFIESEYYKRISSFINNDTLIEILEKNDKYLLFYIHASFQEYVNLFNSKSARIKICTMDRLEVQDIIKQTAMLITDYSSIFTDYIYMKKPVIYYQFDKDIFYTKHTPNYPYINFQEEGFGNVVFSEEDVLMNLQKNIDNNYKLEDNQIKSIENFFGIMDNKNCERIFNCLEKEWKNI